MALDFWWVDKERNRANKLANGIFGIKDPLNI